MNRDGGRDTDRDTDRDAGQNAGGNTDRDRRRAAALHRARTGFDAWLFDLALPFWLERGFGDRLRDGSRPAAEQLTLQGTVSFPGYTRIRVQARQLYVFSIAAERGVSGAAEAAEGLFRFLLLHGRTDAGGWARRVTPSGAAFDPTADLYDIAFVLFALAHHGRVSGDGRALQEAVRTLGFLRRRMAHPAGGFLNTCPVQPGWRQQNPHMHLLEAALALFELDPEQRWADLARELATLFHRHLFDPRTGTLAENFTEALGRAGGIDGDTVEPGHQAEWIWLLDRHDALFGDPEVNAAILALDRVRDGQGVGQETGLMRDEISRDGRLLRGSSRLWPQGELLRAAAVMHRRAATPEQAEGAFDTVLRGTDTLLRRFLVGRDSSTLPPGTWIDQLDAFGLPSIRMIPTSSFYHVVTAWAELDGFRPASAAALAGREVRGSIAPGGPSGD